jgi:hypothetical protein
MLNNIRFANLGGGVALSVHPSPKSAPEKTSSKIFKEKSEDGYFGRAPCCIFIGGHCVD